MPRQFFEDYCRELFDALDQGFCTIEILFDEKGRPNDYRFTDVNAAFEQQTGLRNAVGKRIRELAPYIEEFWFESYGEVARTGKAVRVEHEAVSFGRWYDVYAFRVGEPDEHLVGVLFSDVTDKKRAQAALDAARRETERASRAKDEFLAMLGHELRNPLAPMLTALQLMRLRRVASREQDVLERQVKHLMRMVDDLLDMSRITGGKIELNRQPIELSEVVLGAMELAGSLLEQNRNFVEVQVPPRGAAIHVDRARMVQIVSNLLANASKYSPVGSSIVLSGGRDGGVVRISVKDEGLGLAADMLEAIFEPFVQQPQSQESAGGGLGLGLAIVRDLVKAHGGKVRAESAGRGHGSEFIVELPATDMPSRVQEPDDVETVVPTPSATSQRVLIVDDNQDAAEMLRGALEALGYTVDVAFDGPSALTRAEAFRPAAVLLDIGLPEMDGYEVARRLRASRPEAQALRLLAVTGYGLETDRQRSRDAGFQAHLVKPIDIERLHALLQGTSTSS
jgi:signal transduction histidine kinase/CheY-like chemotaxis protein